MEFFFILKQSIIPLFVTIAIAMVYQRKYKPDVTALNMITLQLLCPILIFRSITNSGSGISALAPVLLFMLLFSLVMALIANIIAKKCKMNEERAIAFISNATFMNFGNMGIPLALFTFGNEVSYEVALVWIVFNIPVSTYGLWLVSHNKNIKQTILTALKIPMFPAFAIAIILNETGIILPDMIGKPLDFIANSTIPLMTLVFGFKLACVKYRKGMFKIMFSGTILRLLISPFVATALVLLLKFPPVLAQITVIMVSTPMAASTIMYAVAFQRDEELTTAMVLFTTLASALTMPFVIMFAKSFFMS